MRIGIDIGGSHIGIGLIDSNGEIIKKHENYLSECPKEITADEFIICKIVSTLVKWQDEGIEIKEIGIGAPGIICENKIVSSVNLGLYDFDIVGRIKETFPDAAIKVINDAKCAALTEKKLGSLKQYDDCIFLCLGTGIGGAGFYDGKLITPRRCAGFEFGHIVIEKNGRECKCGSFGCFEQYCSMRAFKKQIRAALNIDESINGDEFRELIKSNLEAEAVVEIINEFVRNLCIGIASIVNILEPQAICIGGGFVKYKDILFDRFKEEFASSRELFYKSNVPKIVLAEHGNDAGMIGSALCFD